MRDLLSSRNRLIDAKNLLMHTTNNLEILLFQLAWTPIFLLLLLLTPLMSKLFPFFRNKTSIITIPMIKYFMLGNLIAHWGTRNVWIFLF